MYKYFECRIDFVYYFTMGNQKALLEQHILPSIKIEERSISLPYISRIRLGPNSVYNWPIGMIDIGERTDSRGVYLSTFLTAPEYEEEARELVKAEIEKQQARMDSYYAQKWV